MAAATHIQTKADLAPRADRRERLKQSAKRLFASRGFEGAAVRDILADAQERNGASISHFFGSKEGLIEEILTDLFCELDARWAAGLEALPTNAGVRELVTLIADVSTSMDASEEPTATRLVETAARQRLDLLQGLMKRLNLRAYNRILKRIAEKIPHVAEPLLGQRLIFVTRYLSTVFTLYESTYVAGSAAQRRMLHANYDLGNAIDTAVGLLRAEVVNARQP